MSIVLETRANHAKPEAQNEHIPPDRLEQQIRETEIPRSSDGRSLDRAPKYIKPETTMSRFFETVTESQN